MNAGAWGAGIGALCLAPIMGKITYRWARGGWGSLGTGRQVISVLIFMSASLGAFILAATLFMSVLMGMD